VNLPSQTLILMVFGYVIVSRKLAEHDRETV
jgi:hypothetical protein